MYSISRSFAYSILLMFAAALTGLSGCGASKAPSDQGVAVELISIKEVAGNKVKLLFKVTNHTGKHIHRAKAIVDVLDESGNSLGSKGTYVVHGAKGGLAAGESLEEDAFIEVSDNTKAKSMKFEIETLRLRD